MKLVFITGQVAAGIIREIAEKVRADFNIDVDVVVLPIPVAAMMNLEYLKKEIPKRLESLRNADLIIVPGYTTGDMRELLEITGLNVVKGPRYAYDLPLMIKAIQEGVKFSTSIPADEVIKDQVMAIEANTLKEARFRALKGALFNIGNLPVSSHYPLVVLEVYVSGEDELEKYIAAANTADLISIGIPYGFGERKAESVLGTLRERLKDKPIGIDSAEKSLIINTADLVDFINGVSVDSLDWLIKNSDQLKDKPIILVNTQCSSTCCLEKLLKCAELLRGEGYEKIILDPVLQPPLLGLVKSLEIYFELKRIAPHIPLIMGVGNATELVDVDSIGVNALLAFIGVEIGVEMFLTTESSIKTRGSTKELRKALDMAILARDLKRVPKDLSISLLLAKSKKKVDFQLPKTENTIRASKKSLIRSDPKGYFKIKVDHEKGEIIVQHYQYSSSQPTIEIRGADPYEILAELVNRDLLSLVEHYFYMGVELSKARMALTIGKEYEQDKDLF